MELINRYVYAVTKQLSESDRKEVEQELQGIIYEMMDEYANDLTEEEAAKQVIQTLGNPNVLANKYRGRERYLIGPKYFNQYLFVLKIVLFAILIGMSVSSVLGGIVSQHNMAEIMTNYITNLMFTAVQGAAWVTIVFALLDYHNVNIDKEVPWSIKELPEIPNKKVLISRGESVFAIIFSTIFFSVLYFAPQLFSVYYKNGSISETISVFNIEALNQYQYIIIAVMIVTIFHETLKIIWGKWTLKRALISATFSIISGGLAIVFFTNEKLWNIELMNRINDYIEFEMNWIPSIMVAGIVLITLIEIASNVYKGFKYGNK